MTRARDIADSTKTLNVDGGTIKLDGNYPTGTGNVALGDSALDDGSLSGNYNTAVGSGALTSNTSGSNNFAFGANTLYSNTTGSNNAAISGLYSNTTGSFNTGLGMQALNSNTTASFNTALGYTAGYSQTTGGSNTYLGDRTGYSNSTGSLNTFVGTYSGYSTTSNNNTFVGVDSGYQITTGSKNTILGRYNGNQGGLDIRTSSNNIVLSDGDGNPKMYYDGALSSPMWVINNNTTAQWTTRIRHDATSDAYGLIITYNNATINANTNPFIYCNDSTTVRFIVNSNGNVTNTNNSYGGLSDEKLKENIVDASSQWNDIKALKVRKYSMKEDNLDAPNMLGVIAQEVEAAGMGGLVNEAVDKDADNNDLGTVTKQVNYSILYMKAVKALQEAMDRIETLEADVAALKNP